jgi:hypothetical protein
MTKLIDPTFTGEAILYKRDQATGTRLLGPDQQPIQDRSLGIFTFRRPTVYDRMQIGVRRARYTVGVLLLDPQTETLVEAFSVIPSQIEQSPEGWDWSKVYDYWEIMAVHEAFQDGWTELLKTPAGSNGR